MIKVDEQVQKGYKIEVHHIENYKQVNETEVIENDSSGTISEPSVGSDENKRKTNKFNWLFWKKS